MFGRKKAVEVLEVPASRVVTAELPDEEYQRYVETCKELGLERSPAFVLEKIRQVLITSSIRQYDPRQVAAYLAKKLDNWAWTPLRPEDCRAVVKVVEDRGNRWWWWCVGDENLAVFSTTQYALPVPLPVLETARRIAVEVPEALFFVSGRRLADPFLLVTSAGAASEGFIVERWDEPGYRER